MVSTSIWVPYCSYQLDCRERLFQRISVLFNVCWLFFLENWLFHRKNPYSLGIFTSICLSTDFDSFGFLHVFFPLKYIQYQLFLVRLYCHLSGNGFDYKTNRFVPSSSRVLALSFLVFFLSLNIL